MASKTLAMKLLEQRKIPFETVTYPSTERDAEVLAVLYFEVEPDRVFKTLVVPHKKPLLVMVPADRRLNLKKLAKAIGVKKLQMASHREAEAMTGLEVGGISPLALLNRGFAIYADASIQEQSDVFVSAGQKGINLKVPVEPLLNLLGAKIAEVT